MKILSLFLVVVLMFSIPLTINAEEDNIVLATDENINYVGRWIEDDGKMAGSFECYMSLRFTGTSIALNKGFSGNMRYRIDGGEYQKQTTKILAKNLDEGEHLLEICAAAQQAFPKLNGFIIDKDAKTLPYEKKPVIEFIGDSIMEGYIVETDKTTSNSALNSYGHITAEKLGFYRNIVAFGGITVTQGHGNPDKQGMVNRYKQIREYTQNEIISPEWDFSKFTPDYIVINLGTNDGGVPDNEFKMWYISLLTLLRTSYKDAKIFVMTPFNGRHNENIKAVVEGFKDSNIHLIESHLWNVYLGGDGTHPDKETHKKVAERLATEINQIITATPEPEITPEPTPPSGGSNKKLGWVLPVILTSVVLIGGGIGAFLVIKKKKK